MTSNISIAPTEFCPSLDGSDRDVFWEVVADMAFVERIDYLRSCLRDISDKLSEHSHDPDGTVSCDWLTRLTVHTHTGGGKYSDSGWKGSIVHHDAGEDPVLISGAETDGHSGLTRWSGEYAPETIADEGDCSAEDLAKHYADATHVLACQTVEMIGGKVTHYVRIKAFSSKSIGDLEEWVARQFKNSPRLPTTFAKDMMQMLIFSKEYWAGMEKEAELNKDLECVAMARSHQEALEGLLASPMLKEKGLVMPLPTDQHVEGWRLPDIVIPVHPAVRNIIRYFLGGRM